MTRAPAPPGLRARWFDARLLDRNLPAVDSQSTACPVLERGRACRASGAGWIVLVSANTLTMYLCKYTRNLNAHVVFLYRLGVEWIFTHQRIMMR